MGIDYGRVRQGLEIAKRIHEKLQEIERAGSDESNELDTLLTDQAEDALNHINPLLTRNAELEIARVKQVLEDLVENAPEDGVQHDGASRLGEDFPSAHNGREPARILAPATPSGRRGTSTDFGLNV